MTDEEVERMIEYLEADQLVADTSRHLPRARLSPTARIGLWALRIFALVMGAMVVYVFAASLG